MEIKILIETNQHRQIAEYLQEYFRRIFYVQTSIEIARINVKRYYNYLRKQYNAEKILAYLKKGFAARENRRIVAILPYDAYVEGLNFVFGIAEENWGGIVFTYRLNPQLYGQPFHPIIFYVRIFKIALHEFGHSIGLAHCNNPSCVMWFDNSIEDVDRKSLNYCIRCRIEISRRYPELLRL